MKDLESQNEDKKIQNEEQELTSSNVDFFAALDEEYQRQRLEVKNEDFIPKLQSVKENIKKINSTFELGPFKDIGNMFVQNVENEIEDHDLSKIHIRIEAVWRLMNTVINEIDEYIKMTESKKELLDKLDNNKSNVSEIVKDPLFDELIGSIDEKEKQNM